MTWPTEKRVATTARPHPTNERNNAGETMTMVDEVLFRESPSPLAIRDDEGRLVDANAAYISFVGAYSIDELKASLPGIVAPAHQGKERDDSFRDGRPLAGAMAFRRLDGCFAWGRVTPIRMPGRHGDPVWCEHIDDVTELRHERVARERRMLHDELTGLASRRPFMEELAASTEAGESCAVLLVDLDRFRVHNDSHGHAVGNEMIRVVADRLQRILRPEDLLARFGGDEYAILIPGPDQESEALSTANRVIAAVDEEICVGDTRIFVTASVGIAFSEPGAGAEDVVRHAEAALYRAKGLGRNRHCVFTGIDRSQVTSRSRLEADLRRAIDASQLAVHYQPEVDLVDGSILGVEALVRWQHPERGVVPANEFIELAEETGQIHPIGEHVLLEATRQIADWNDDAALPDLIARVNISARELERPLIVERISGALRESGLAADRLCLEVTETAIMVDVEESMARLERITDLGVSVAIDDFGTGFSSLAYLRRFPVDVLKIDRTFVNGLTSGDRVIVQAVLDLADAMSLEVVAEGVETEAQREVLMEMGCRRAQGWLFSKALPAGELTELLRKRRLIGG